MIHGKKFFLMIALFFLVAHAGRDIISDKEILPNVHSELESRL